ncbi:protein NIM1-INTERACTING 2 [Solanum dulcamara]|uniref:protein NIM1-INTERACTING 2 n=1 Tax=Solanum dulcamara TaxID=45834 RepID=UPI00248614CC|nr:protein NIM1-INTERACTING 2 [Solanum dulcamara]
MESEGEKRKPGNNDVVSTSATKKPKEETEELTEEVAEEEVEEFFAILRRIHVAVKYFNKVDGASTNGRKMTENIHSKFSDDIVGDNEEKEKKKDVEENNKGFDLNMEPNDPHDHENNSS